MTTLLSFAETNYRIHFIVSSPGRYFQHRFSIQLLSVTVSRSVTKCAAKCGTLPHCRTFDYDPSSNQCRLFEADSTTGTIIAASSPTSVVGSLHIMFDLYSPSHDQPCAACEQSRYEVCSSNTGSCQCPPHAYWDGEICRLHLFENDTCTQRDACRSDLNLTCASSCYGDYQRCVPSTMSKYELSMLFPLIWSVWSDVQIGMGLSEYAKGLQWPVDALETRAPIRQSCPGQTTFCSHRMARSSWPILMEDCWPFTRTIEQAEQWQRLVVGQHSCTWTTEQRRCM